MAFIAPERIPDREYDVVIIGSGAAGGQVAYTLAMEGVKVLMLEAGRRYVPETETAMFHTPNQAPLRGVSTPDKDFGFYDASVDGGWSLPGEPYLNAPSGTDRGFTWWRSRMLGGRTNHWQRIAMRFGPYDFKPRTRDGLGFDWPISYEDLAPYYDKVEMLVGVYGSNEGLENTPNSPDGCLLPAPRARVSELLLQDRAKKVGVPIIANHRAVLTQRLDHHRLPRILHPGNARAQEILAREMQSRSACLWATDCERGCSVRANYQSPTVHLPPALATGDLDVVCNAMAREVTLAPTGRANGVTFIDKSTGQERHVPSRVVVLAGGACESVRLLLNSTSPRFPQGLGNQGGRVGRHLMDSVGSSIVGQVPLLESMPAHNEDGSGGSHVYAPWWLYGEQLAGKLGFPRGYHIETRGGRRMPTVSTFAALDELTGGSYGHRFKEDARRYYGSFIFLAGRGDMIPNEHSFCERSPDTKDRWGIPVLRFHWRWSEHELAQVAHMHRTFAQLIDAMGGRLFNANREATPAELIQAGGSVIHEVGGAMMGEDPQRSVTNRWGQTHDVPNVFVADGATFVSKSDKSPTLTIMALAWRTADHIVARLRRREL